MSVPIEAQLAELKRERKMRESAYPRFIERGSLKPEAAKRQIEALDAAIDTIRKTRANGTAVLITPKRASNTQLRCPRLLLRAKT